jgi:hypothetical protein
VEEHPAHLNREVVIRTLGVGLLAIAALAMAGMLLARRHRPAPVAPARGGLRDVGDIYAAGW